MSTLGTRIHVAVTWEINGTPFDPVVVKLRLVSPPVGLIPGVITDYVYGVDVALERAATGQYQLSILPSAVGVYKYAWISTAADEEVVKEGSFKVDKRAF